MWLGKIWATGKKGENAAYRDLLLFQQCFQTLLA